MFNIIFDELKVVKYFKKNNNIGQISGVLNVKYFKEKGIKG